MEVQLLSAAAIGIALVAFPQADKATDAPGGLVGRPVFASETHLDRWGRPTRADEVRLEALGTVTDVVAASDDRAGAVLVSVGGLWGWGAQEVEVGLDRVHLLEAGGGAGRLVVDLSAEGTEPVSG